MISPGLFMLMHLAMVLGLLVGLAALARRERRAWTTWHRGIRTRRLTTDEVFRRLRKAAESNSAQNLDSL